MSRFARIALLATAFDALARLYSFSPWPAFQAAAMEDLVIILFALFLAAAAAVVALFAAASDLFVLILFGAFVCCRLVALAAHAIASAFIELDPPREFPDSTWSSRSGRPVLDPTEQEPNR